MTTGFRRELHFTDFTLLVIGTIIGDGIFILSGLGAHYLGPAQLVSWGVAGVLAALIGLAFVQCASMHPEVGGSYAYVASAFGPTAGFLAGWALYLGELAALPVFPLAFARYLAFFLPLDSPAAIMGAKISLIIAVTAVNLLGVRASSRLNDVLTLAKVASLLLVIAVGVAFAVARPSDATHNLAPFAPLGWGGFGTATVLIFWAYAGFELAVLPAGEVAAPRRTLPRGLLVGCAVATAVYLLTALSVVIGLRWQDAADSARPLTDALSAMLNSLGFDNGWAPGLVCLGALLSIVGVCDAFMLALARLSYALAASASFPPAFARLDARHATPWVGLVFQAVLAVGASIILDIPQVLGTAVFFLGLCYAATALSALRLVARAPERALHLPGLRVILLLAVAAGGYLAAQAPPALVAYAAVALTLGLLVYRWRRHAWQALAAAAPSAER